MFFFSECCFLLSTRLIREARVGLVLNLFFGGVSAFSTSS